MTNNTDLVPVTESYRAPVGMLMPIATADEARAAITAYENLKATIIRPADVQRISGKDHIKKSGWLRIARAFGLTVEPITERYETADDGTWGYAVVVRAIAPNGASMQGDGMCWSSEKKEIQRTRHNVRAHAYTRATNRAISNLVGGGEVSAEEMQEFDTPYVDAKAKAKPADPWADVRELAAQLALTNAERDDLFKRHKKQHAPILAELRARIARDTEPDVEFTVAEQEPDGERDLSELPAGRGGRLN